MVQIPLRLMLVATTIMLVTIKQASSHGMMLTPTNRASLWRYDSTQPTNYEDSEYFCGGTEIQYTQNDGKCGVCGDNYANPRPRDNENTGFFGNGIVTSNYTSGQIIRTSVLLTANHLGYFTYSLCILEDVTQPEPEDCFENLLLADGSTSYPVTAHEMAITNEVKLPDGVACTRCVLRWHYNTGNSWGLCKNGAEDMGCGEQEIFRSCSDITIF